MMKSDLGDSIQTAQVQVISDVKVDGKIPQATVSGNTGNMFSNQSNGNGIGFDMEQADFLKSLGFTKGLISALASNYKTFKKRVWLVDNSGSMKMTDGTKIVFQDSLCKCFGSGDSTKTGRTVQVSRWEELQGCVDYHVEMAAHLQIPTSFRLLNAPDRKNPHINSTFDIGAESFSNSGPNIEQSHTVMAAEPAGPTPLALHLRRIRSDLEMISHELESSGQKVVIIIATDGIPTNERGYTGKEITQDFVNALNQVYKFPVWVVFRLCTNNLEVLEYYNGLDMLLERPVEVLNDFMDESQEVNKCNPWINYAQPLHRCREFGFHHRLFDLIDERPLTLDEAVDYCALLFGKEFKDEAPDPQADWKGFVTVVEKHLADETPQWNPCTKSIKPWINVTSMKLKYGDSSGCSVM